jgi:putative transposase
MGRALRQAASGVVYHVLNRRVLRLPLFEDDGDYLAFERVLVEALQQPHAPALFCFCLMPNHWHLLLRPRTGNDLSRWMQWLTVTHTHRWHRHHGTAGTGPLYQGRFKSFPVQTDEHFLIAARYVERNGLRAKLCRRAEQWRWSSLALRQGAAGSEVETALRQALSPWPLAAPRQWLRQVNEPHSTEELAALQRSITRGTPLGSERWIERTATHLGLESTLRPRGRPRKQPNKST